MGRAWTRRSSRPKRGIPPWSPSKPPSPSRTTTACSNTRCPARYRRPDDFHAQQATRNTCVYRDVPHSKDGQPCLLSCARNSISAQGSLQTRESGRKACSGGTKEIVSRHAHRTMRDVLLTQYESLRRSKNLALPIHCAFVHIYAMWTPVRRGRSMVTIVVNGSKAVSVVLFCS